MSTLINFYKSKKVLEIGVKIMNEVDKKSKNSNKELEDFFSEITSKREDVSIVQLEVGDIIVGNYEGIIELGDYKAHKIRLANGELKGVFETYQIEKTLNSTIIGKTIKIEYLGKIKLENGKEVHDFRIFVKGINSNNNNI